MNDGMLTCTLFMTCYSHATTLKNTKNNLDGYDEDNNDYDGDDADDTPNNAPVMMTMTIVGLADLTWQ